MHRRQFQATFCHHEAGNRAIDASGDQQRGPAGSTRGHAVGTGDLLGIQEGLLPHLHPDLHLGMMHVHAQLRIRLQNGMAQFPVDGFAVHGELFICPAAEALEGGNPRLAFQGPAHQGQGRRLDGRIRLIHGHGGADPMDAKDPAKPVHRLIPLFFAYAKYIDAALVLPHLDGQG